MTPDDGRLAEQLCASGRSLFDRGLTHGSSGNVSVRSDDGFLITPTGASLGRLSADRLARLDPDGRPVGGPAATKELPLHLAVYRARGEVRAIVHLHSPWSVALACLDGLDPANALPALTAYQVMKVGPLPLVPYYRPGDPALGAAVSTRLGQGRAVLLANHGPVVAATSLGDAVDAMEELEATARLFLTLRGSPVRPLTASEVDGLRGAFGVTWPSSPDDPR